MKEEAQRFQDRFGRMFANDGLSNVKFFVRKRDGLTPDKFKAEVNRIEDTVSAGGDLVRQVTSIDRDKETKLFDAPF